MTPVCTRVLVALVTACLLPAAGHTTPANIHDAAAAGDLAKVRSLVEQEPALVGARDHVGRTPLHRAAASGQAAVAAYLIERGADLDAADNNGSTPLHAASWSDRDAVARLLLDKGAKVGIADGRGRTPLSAAAARCSAKVAPLLLDAGAAVEGADPYGRTPLLLAARESGCVEIARLLLNRKANVNAADKFGDTPLMLAAWRGFGPLVELLLERGAVVPLDGPDAKELLQDAASKGLLSLFTRMADGGARLDLRGERGRSLLHDAACGGSLAIVERLLAGKLDPDEQDRDGWTPLHNAAYFNRVDVLNALLEKGADPNRRTLLGQTAWNLAAEHDLVDVGAVLATVKGADLGPPKFPELSGAYLGQRPPGRTPEEFAVGIVGGRFSSHSAVAFSPDGREAYWSELLPPRGTGYADVRMMTSRLAGDRWTYPQRAKAGAIALEDVPVIARDGKRIYDMSTRPLSGRGAGDKENIWVADRVGEGWGPPRPLPPAVNALPHHWQFSVGPDAAVYFSSSWKGASGIFLAQPAANGYAEPVLLAGPLATTAGDEMPFVAADGSYLLFERALDIHVSFRAGGGEWTAAVPLPAPVNTRDSEVCPVVSPDGRYLFFIRSGRVFWVDAAAIEELRPRAGDKRPGAK